MKKFENIQALRAIAAMMVVFFHIAGLEMRYFHGMALSPYFTDLGNAGVDIFFVISGFIMVQVTQGKFQNKFEINKFFLNRIKRIYPLYWFYSLLVVLAIFIYPHISSHKWSVDGLIKSFLLIPQQGDPYLIVGWTLIHEMYFYITMILLLCAPEKFFVSLLWIWIFFIIICHFIHSFTSPIMLLITHPLTCEFIAGCLVAKLYSKIKKLLAWFIFLCGIIMFMVVGYGHILTGNITNNWLRVELYGVPSVLLVWGSILLGQYNVLFPVFLRKLGDASYSIYLSHLLVIAGLGILFKRADVNNILLHATCLIMQLILAIMVGLISYKYLEKPLILFFTKKKEIKIAPSMLSA